MYHIIGHKYSLNINGWRAQLGQEMAKEKSTKSGHNTDELYSSNWIHYDKLAFLVPAIGASKSRDTLKRINLQEDENKKEVGGTPVAKRETLVEKKLDLLSKCTETITANTNTESEICNYKNVCLFFTSRKSFHNWINVTEK